MFSYHATLELSAAPKNKQVECTRLSVKKVKGLGIYIAPLTGRPLPAAVYNSKWRTDWQ